MKTVLSIAIPAYGRPQETKDNVMRLLQCERNDIEFLVVDNDETGEQIKDWMLAIKDERFHYYQNEKNIGRSNNIAKVAELAESDHVLIMTSDEKLCLDVLDEIIEKIREYPDFGIILGRVLTSLGRQAFEHGAPGVYEKGIEALMQLPFLGELNAMVVNRKYLDFKKLYNQNEIYMQYRLGIMALEHGKYIFMDRQFSNLIDTEEIHLNLSRDEVYRTGNFDKKKWSSTAAEFYTPRSRGMELRQYLELIDSYNLRLNQRIQLIDKWVTYYTGMVLIYVLACQSPAIRRMQGGMELCGYEEALNVWKSELLPFFQKKEEEERYCYVGRFEDVIKNELILIHQAEKILESICECNKIAIYGEGRVSERLQMTLSCMGVSTVLCCEQNDITEALVLVPYRYDESVEKNLLEQGAYNVLFMDRMGKYLSIVWCDRHQTPDNFNHYVIYID